MQDPLGGEGASLTVHHMSCGKARKIVLAFYRVSQSQGPHATVHGFDCDAKSGSGFPIVKCRRGEKRLRYEGGFYKGASPVLGSNDFAPPPGEGFGESAPATIYNGGDANGLVEHIHWRNWGSARAMGTGRGHMFKPQGGYYRHSVEVRLRALGLGHCPGDPTPAYTRLRASFQKRPGGPFTPWFNWAGAKSICESPFAATRNFSSR